MKYIIFAVFLLIVRAGTAQNKSELPFIEHLVNKGFYNEAIHLIDNNHHQNYSQEQLDSLNYYRGWALYSLKNLEQSTISFVNVGKASSFYLKSRFFAGYNQIFLGNYSEASGILDHLDIQNETNASLVNFELTGMNMLQGKWPEAKAKLQQVNPNIAFVNQQVLTLGQIIDKHENHRRKSPFLAGVMSSIIPGSGKIYAGKMGEGIASLISTTGFGFVAWENNRKLQITI